MNPLHFRCLLDSSSGGPIKIPDDVRELFGRAKPPVLVTIRAGREHTYRSTVAVYGGEYYVPLKKANATAAGIIADEPFDVTLQPDDAPRVVNLPDDLSAAVNDAGLRERWNQLSYTRQREFAEAIEGAKRADTRRRRIQKTIQQLGDSNPD